MTSTNTPRKLQRRLQQLLQDEWAFLDEPWPKYPKKRTHHRSEFKAINGIQHMKEVLLRRLGPIAVFFFLTTLWNMVYFPGPYKALEKGIAFLYYFVAGESMESMSVFLPRSSFYDIFRVFFKEDKEKRVFDKEISRCLSHMFSTPEIRMRSAHWKNPENFRHITLLLDGHDTRATYGETRAEMYSYKLKKSGLRTQVCIDVNGMVVFVSKSASCRDFNDGTMLKDMDIGKKIHEADCIALDGGYTQFIPAILEKDETLDIKNFCFPIRKKVGQLLDQDEATFNTIFGSFRSMVENTFGDLGKTFIKFNNKDPVRTSTKKEANMMLRLCFLLMNVRNMSTALDLEVESHYNAWMEEGFDYPSERNTVLEETQVETVQIKIGSGSEMQQIQEALLGMSMSEDEGPESGEDVDEEL